MRISKFIQTTVISRLIHSNVDFQSYQLIGIFFLKLVEVFKVGICWANTSLVVKKPSLSSLDFWAEEEHVVYLNSKVIKISKPALSHVASRYKEIRSTILNRK